MQMCTSHFSTEKICSVRCPLFSAGVVILARGWHTQTHKNTAKQLIDTHRTQNDENAPTRTISNICNVPNENPAQTHTKPCGMTTTTIEYVRPRIDRQRANLEHTTDDCVGVRLV